MSDYPSLQPAMTLHVELGGVTPVGSHSRGTALDIAAMTGGSLKSEPGLSPTLDCEWSGQGEDYIHRDPDGKRMRLDAHAAVRDKDSGGHVCLHYTGVVGITPALGRILSGSHDAESTEFGDSFIEMRFETGVDKLKELEQGIFVGAGRFIFEHGKPIVVEYKISQVMKGR